MNTNFGITTRRKIMEEEGISFNDYMLQYSKLEARYAETWGRLNKIDEREDMVLSGQDYES